MFAKSSFAWLFKAVLTDGLSDPFLQSKSEESEPKQENCSL